MNFLFLMIGSFISFIGMIFHGFVGARIYIRNINNSNLEPLTKSLSLVSWHVFTIVLFVSFITLAFIAYNPEYALIAYPLIAVNMFGSLLFIFLGVDTHRPLLKLPGAYLMAITAAMAWLGIS